jgi:polyisoprenoid-binding protein YceI
MMKTLVSALTLGCILAIPSFAADPKKAKGFLPEPKTFSIDTNASQLNWKATKVTGAHEGSIKLKSGAFQMFNGELKGAELVADMNSIDVTDIPRTNSSHAKLIGHLKSDDFFSVAQNPTATLKVNKITALTTPDKDANTHTLEGLMTIKGATHPIKFPVKFEAERTQATLSGIATLDRTIWNIKYGSGKFFQNLGDKMIHDPFTIGFKILAKSQ